MGKGVYWIVRRIGKLLPDNLRSEIRFGLSVVDNSLYGLRLNNKIKYSKNFHILKGIVKPDIRILFYPNKPEKFYTLYKIVVLLGYRIVYGNKLNNYDVVIKWKDATYTDPLPIFLRDKPHINADCIDISKRFISKVFDEVFGYALSINPLEYKGPIVVKSNRNFAHDGQIVEGPINKNQLDDSKVYQVLIDNIDPYTGLAVDLRVPIFGKNIPIVWKKYKKIDERFGRNVIMREIAYPEEVFAEDEICKMIEVAVRMGLEYGEMDVLRDKKTKRIYIVDVNSTPALDKTIAYFLKKDSSKAYILMKSLCEGFVGLLREKGVNVLKIK